MAKAIPKNKYGVKCPSCGSTSIWKVGWTPSKEGRKDRFKCTVCATTFYKGQPGTLPGQKTRKSKK